MTPETKPNKGTSRGRRILLIASLGLNILVLFVVIGAAVGLQRHGGSPRSSSMDGPGAVYVRALEFDDKRALGREIRKAQRELKVNHKEDRVLIEDMASVLRSTPFDAEMLKSVRATLNEKSALRRQVAFDVWLSYVEEMSAEDREAYADRMLEVLEKGPRKYKKDKPPRD